MNKKYETLPYFALNDQRGINLIEIMVAMTIGLFLVLGATTLYINSKKTTDIDDAAARLQETARYAMSIIESDVRMASYWGLNSDSSSFGNKNTCLDGSTTRTNCSNDSPNKVEKYIESYNQSSLSCSNLICTATSISNNSIPPSDSLIIRRTSTQISTIDPNTTKAVVCSTRSNLSLFRSNAISCPASPNGEVHDLMTNGYYIKNNASGIPSLYRQTLSAGPSFIDTEIIPGIEDMQIELGWDNGTGPTDTVGAVRYIAPNNLPSGGRIVSVRIWLLVRSDSQDATFTDDRSYTYASTSNFQPNDHFKRILVSKTIFIRNA
jgi:type IV pilus assembly protein PilW